MVPARTAHAALVILAILATLLLVYVMLPFGTSLFVAAVLAGALQPVTGRLAGLLRGRRNVAAGLLTLAVVVAVVGPFSGLGVVVVPQVVSGVGWLREAMQSEGVAGLVARVPETFRPAAGYLVASIPGGLERIQELVAAEGGRAATVLGNVLTATGSFLFQSVLMLIALYFLLLDGPRLVRWLDAALPLKRGQVSELLREFRRTTVSVLVSTIAVAAVQSTAAAVGYVIAGVPNAVFFGLLTFLLALVPAVGATVVVLVVAGVKYATGHTGAAVFLGIWGVAVVALIDNVLKPVFIRGSVPIHGAVIFFALFGGLAAFGPVGFLIGPLAVSFLVAVVRMYRRDFGK